MRVKLLRDLLQGGGRFLRDEGGQDLIEYSLLIGLLAVASAALFARVGQSTSTVWTDAKGILSTAALEGAS